MNQDEIDDQLRSELIEKYRDINVDHDWWEFVYEDFKTEMITKGITVDKINFSGFYSQGDGACFMGQIDMKVFLKAHDLEQKYMGATFFAEQGELYGDVTNARSTYYHEQSVNISLELDNYNNYVCDDLRYEVYETMEKIIVEEWKELEEEVAEQCRSYMRDLYRQLRDEYEALTTDEAVWETIVANELHVLEAV